MVQREQFTETPLEIEQAVVKGTEFIRSPDGVWRYADNWIPVPGARDVTLTDRFQPKQVVNAEGEVERVIVDGHSIAAHPELLDWCLSDGTPIEDEGELIEVLVPYNKWEARDRIPNELIVPEIEGSVAEQQVAAAERKYREAERTIERAADYRAEVLRRHAPEMTRQEARAITGLSVGRIQQLIRSEQLEPHELELLKLFASGPISQVKALVKLARSTNLPADPELLNNLTLELEARGFLNRDPRGRDGVGLSELGKQVVYSEAVASRGEAD
jgi:hypothetical protein